MAVLRNSQVGRLCGSRKSRGFCYFRCIDVSLLAFQECGFEYEGFQDGHSRLEVAQSICYAQQMVAKRIKPGRELNPYATRHGFASITRSTLGYTGCGAAGSRLEGSMK